MAAEMSTYWTLVNHTKKEMVEPHPLRTGAQWSQIVAISDRPGLKEALALLVLRFSEEDFLSLDQAIALQHGHDYQVKGRWGGDSVEIITEHDIDREQTKYDAYVDISELVHLGLQEYFEGNFTGGEGPHGGWDPW